MQKNERESDLSAMPLQPSFQIRAALSLENVTFSWSRQGIDGGTGKGGVGGKTNGGRVEGAERRLHKREDGRIKGE